MLFLKKLPIELCLKNSAVLNIGLGEFGRIFDMFLNFNFLVQKNTWPLSSPEHVFVGG